MGQLPRSKVEMEKLIDLFRGQISFQSQNISLFGTPQERSRNKIELKSKMQCKLKLPLQRFQYPRGRYYRDKCKNYSNFFLLFSCEIINCVSISNRMSFILVFFNSWLIWEKQKLLFLFEWLQMSWLLVCQRCLEFLIQLFF